MVEAEEQAEKEEELKRLEAESTQGESEAEGGKERGDVSGTEASGHDDG